MLFARLTALKKKKNSSEMNPWNGHILKHISCILYPPCKHLPPSPITQHPIQWWSHLESILGPTGHPSLMIQTSLERIYMVYYQCSNRVHPMQHKIWSSWWITDFLAFLDKIWSTHLRIKNCKILILDNYLLFIFKLNWGKRLMCIEHT